jgi:hypothetical protein
MYSEVRGRKQSPAHTQRRCLAIRATELRTLLGFSPWRKSRNITIADLEYLVCGPSRKQSIADCRTKTFLKSIEWGKETVGKAIVLEFDAVMRRTEA